MNIGEHKTQTQTQKQIVKQLLDQGCLINKGALALLTQDDLNKLSFMSERPKFINENILKKIRSDSQNLRRPADTKENIINEKITTSVEVINSLKTRETESEKTIDDFLYYFNDRFHQLSQILMERRELKAPYSISNLPGGRQNIAVIGMVSDIYPVKNGRYIITIEDPSGSTKVLVNAEDGSRIVQDEVIGVTGTCGDKIIFAKQVLWPDLPIPTKINTTKEKVFAAFCSDLHVGSKNTLRKKIEQFVNWIYSANNNHIAERIGYVFIAGDIVDGIGIYQGHEKDLSTSDIYKQYEEFEEIISKIPEHIQVIIGPGNHDIVRMAEPQPPLPAEIIPTLKSLKNIHIVPNPAYVTIHGHEAEQSEPNPAPSLRKNERGISVLMYHGYSFDGHINTLGYLRKEAYAKPSLVMIDLLKRRHLAPTYSSNLLYPEKHDYLVINRIPDVFLSGHVHSFTVANYKGVSLICGGTFQTQTTFQKRVGHKPDPGKVCLMDLSTRTTLVKVF